MAMGELENGEAAPSVDSLYIDGEWRPARSGDTFDVSDPSSGEVLARVASGSTAEARAAVAAAERAFGEWSARTAYERSQVLYEAHRLMLERAEDLAKLMTTEQ